MKAVVITKDKVLLYTEVPDPDQGDGEVLIEIHAAGINRADLMQRRLCRKLLQQLNGSKYKWKSQLGFFTKKRIEVEEKIFLNKTAIVTGAAHGIGKATALLMVKEGASVTIIDVNKKGVKQWNIQGKQLLSQAVPQGWVYYQVNASQKKAPISS